MRIPKYTIAVAELLLLFPAFLFLAALVVRSLQPAGQEPAHTAQQIVDWYAMRPFAGLWVLMIALPLTVLVTGCGTLLYKWSHELAFRQAARNALAVVRPNFAMLIVAGTTLGAGGVLAIVALHMLSD